MSDVSVETEPSQAEGPEAQAKHEVGGQGQAEEAQQDPEDAQAMNEGALQGRDQYDDVVYDVDLSDSGDDTQGDASQSHKVEARLDTGASRKDIEAAPTGNDTSLDAKLKVTVVLWQPSCSRSFAL